MRTPVSRIEVIVGLFAILVVALLVLALFNAARDANLLGEDLEFEVWIKEGQGLAPGSPVTLSQVEIGRVTGVELMLKKDEEEIRAAALAAGEGAASLDRIGPVRVAFTVRKQHESWIRVGTTAQVASAIIPGISKSEIELVLGDGEAALTGGRLPTVEKTGMLAVVDDLRDQIVELFEPTATNVEKTVTSVRGIVQNVDGLLAEFRRGEGDSAAIMRNIRKISDDLAQGKGIVGQALTDETMAQDIKATIAHAKGTLAEVEKISRDLAKLTANAEKLSDEATQKLLERVDPILAQVRSILTKGDRAMGDAADIVAEAKGRTTQSLDKIESLLQELVETMSRLPAIAEKADLQLLELGRIMISLKRNFLIRGNLPGPVQRPSEADALPRGGQR